MKFLFLLFATLFILQRGSSQSYFQKLQDDYAHCNTDTDRVFALYELADYYTWLNSDSAFVYASRAIDLSDKIKFLIGRYLGLRTMCFAAIATGNYPKALEIALRKLKVIEQFKGFKETVSWTVPQDIGVLYRAIGNTNASMKNLRESIAILDRLDRLRAQPLKQLEFDRFGPYSMMSLSYLAMKRADSALWYAKKGYDICSHADNKKRLPLAAATLGNVYEAIGDYSNADHYYRTGIEASKEFDGLYFRTRLYNNLSGLFNKENEPDSCIYYAQLALQLAQENKFGDYASSACAILASVYNKRHAADSELKYTRIMLAAKDTIFSQAKMQQFSMQVFDEQQRQNEIEVERERYRSQLKLYILLVAVGVFLLLSFILYLNNRNKRRANALLRSQKEEIERQRSKAEIALRELKSTQAQLVQSEKMASLGELTAGIAHEIQNPLNFVNNFSEVNQELLAEMNQEIDKGNFEEVKTIAGEIVNNQGKINHHGKRAEAIVKGMLQHSRTSTGQKELTDINALCDEYLRLAYHGLRAKDKTFNATFKTNFDPGVEKIKIVPQEMGRVFLNLINNAFYAVGERQKVEGVGYDPAVIVSTKKLNDKVEVKVKDNGGGIPPSIKEKIFQPFFTTKPTGEGTGLGLSLAYDIVKAHGGELTVGSKQGEGSEFFIILPL